MGPQPGVQGSLCLPALTLHLRDLSVSYWALGPFHSVPSTVWAQLKSTGPILLPASPAWLAVKDALCPFFPPKKCVFNQFYNKTQTEFLKTTAI